MSLKGGYSGMYPAEIVDPGSSWCVVFQARDPTTLKVVKLSSRTPGGYGMSIVAPLRARPCSNRRPEGLWTLPGLPVLWTRKRTRAHSTLDAGKRPPASTAPWKTGQTDGRFSTSAHRPRLRLGFHPMTTKEG